MSGCGCKCRPQQSAQQQFGAALAGDQFEPDFGLPTAGGQSALELFDAWTEAGAEASVAAADEADNELAEAALEDEQAAQQELDAALAEAEAGEAVEPGLDELLALLRNRPGLKLTLSY